MVRAIATQKPGAPLAPYEYDPGELGDDHIEIDVIACGVCHSDLSMMQNDWGNAQYPLVPGHEVVGTVAKVGRNVKHLPLGSTVGLGWFSASCMVCDHCMGGDHNLCRTAEQTIVGRAGGFADKVRCKAEWAVLLPADLDAKKAGPLFCGGITVFNPIVQFDVKPTDHVGVIGIGGLGHLAVQFLAKWGCEVAAFTSSDSKAEEAKRFGAHHVVNSRDESALSAVAGTFDFILSTVNVDLDWQLYLNALRPKGRLHTVGGVLKPIPVPAFSLIAGQRNVSGTPLGSPATTRKMLEFCGRHGIAPVTEHFKMSEANDAIEHLKAGKARYRIVLENDFS